MTKKQNHFQEIVKLHQEVEEKYGLTKEQKKHIEERYEFLSKVWGIETK